MNTRHHLSFIRNVTGLKTNMINTRILTITTTARSRGLASVASVPPGKVHVSAPGHKQNALDCGISHPTFTTWLINNSTVEKTAWLCIECLKKHKPK